MNPDILTTAVECQRALNDALAADPSLWHDLVMVWSETTLPQWAAILAEWLPQCKPEGV